MKKSGSSANIDINITKVLIIVVGVVTVAGVLLYVKSRIKKAAAGVKQKQTARRVCIIFYM